MASKNKRKYISITLLILMLLSVNFFEVGVMKDLFGGIKGFVIYMILLVVVYIYFCGLGYKKENYHGYLAPVLWIVAGLFVSFIGAYKFYGQSLIQSMISTRLFSALLAAPIFVCMNPTHEDTKKAVYAFAIIDFLITLYAAFIDQSIIHLKEGREFLTNENDIVRMLPGLHFTVIAFSFALDDVLKEYKPKHMAMVVLFFAVLVINSNRTFLFAALMVVVLALTSMSSSRNKGLILASLFVIGIIFFVWFGNIFLSLYQETTEQIGDTNYNRVKSLMYMFTCPKGPLSYIIGNGFISANVNSLMPDLFSMGIYYSDVGFVGFWNQFGILTTVAILYFVIKGLDRRHSFVVRASSVIILCASLTIAYFASMEKLCWLSFYLLLYYQDLMSKPELMYRGRGRQNRYRSLAG